MPHTLLDRHCALPVSMRSGRTGEANSGKRMFCFICAVSEEGPVMFSVMKTIQTDSRD